MKNRIDPNGLPADAGIFDSEGKFIGTIDILNAQVGQLAVLKGVFATETIILPLRVIDRASAEGIYLNVRKAELQDVLQRVLPEQ